MKPPPKTGRRASQAERDMARALVESYEFNGDPDELYQALKRFARDGTLAQTVDVRPMVAKAIAKYAGPTFEDKVHAVMDEFHVSEATAARMIRKRPTVKP